MSMDRPTETGSSEITRLDRGIYNSGKFLTFCAAAATVMGAIPVAATYGLSKFPLSEAASEALHGDINTTLSGMFFGAIALIGTRHKNAAMTGALVGAFMGVHNTLAHREAGDIITHNVQNSGVVRFICELPDNGSKPPSICLP